MSIMQVDIPAGQHIKTVNVWRNHAFEPLIALIEPFASYGRWHPEFRISDYDDALTFSNHQPADAETIWFDSSRFLPRLAVDDLIAWLAERIAHLRRLSGAPILLATWLPYEGSAMRVRELTDALPGLHFADLGTVCDDRQLLNTAIAGATGTPLSKIAQLSAARHLACRWLPAVLFPAIKAIAVDLDNTLHQGVLGEDGPAGIVLTDAHMDLQRELKALQQKGIFLALISRNEMEDVERLFEERPDYPLRLEDFSAVEVSWGRKADALAKIAGNLRIGLDAVVVIDDNPGELADMTSAHPEVSFIHAHADAAETSRCLFFFPGVWRPKVQQDDLRRIDDLKAATERHTLLQSSVNADDYLRGLNIELSYRAGEAATIARLAELCRKTNQFNLNLRRSTDAELATLASSDDGGVMGVDLRDRLSESGTIAVIAGRREGAALLIEEVCVSCRALGRKLEDAIIVDAIRKFPAFQGVAHVLFAVDVGPRNRPALAWLESFAGIPEISKSGIYRVPAERFQNFKPPEFLVDMEMGVG